MKYYIFDAQNGENGIITHTHEFNHFESMSIKAGSLLAEIEREKNYLSGSIIESDYPLNQSPFFEVNSTRTQLALIKHYINGKSWDHEVIRKVTLINPETS